MEEEEVANLSNRRKINATMLAVKTRLTFATERDELKVCR